ncbi:MAG: response regulator transcription factor [Burkholderiales bacterium]|nr:response regulator transcription factor [Burkholderiales bacterium]
MPDTHQPPPQTPEIPQTPDMPIVAVGLIDDHAVVRDGYKRYLELDGKIEVRLEASTAEEGYQALAITPVDVLIMDLSMPGIGGLEGIRRILNRYPEQTILVFSMHQNAAMALQALRAGAKGYLTKNMPPDAIVQAIHEVMQGGEPIAPELKEELLRKNQNHGSAEQEHPHLALTPREFDIFLMLADGNTVEDISQRLHLGTKTVANYQTLIRQKLEIHNAVDLYKYATRHGLL